MVDISTLNPVALAAAERAERGGLTITSARRTAEDQARAMASDVILNHQYIGETYVASPIRDALQAWVDRNSAAASDQSTCEQGLLGVMSGFADDDLRHLSWHMSGDAFDCEPDGNDTHLALLHQIVADSVASGGDAKLLTQEAGLVRWHVQLVGGAPPSGSTSSASAGHGSAGASAATPSPTPTPTPTHVSHSSGPAFSGTLLMDGSSGEEVRVWQERLQVLGHSLHADGIFGPITEQATKEFQTTKGLTDDGIVGEHTWTAAWS